MAPATASNYSSPKSVLWGIEKRLGLATGPSNKQDQFPASWVLFVGINHLTYGKENNMEAGTMIIIVGSILCDSVVAKINFT